MRPQEYEDETRRRGGFLLYFFYMNEYNSKVVISTLQQLIKILETHRMRYRFLGSLIVAAINGELHRNLGDLDMIIDSKDRDILYNVLKKLGYKQAGGMFAFARKYLSLDQIAHSTLLDVGFFCGTWQPDGSFIIGNKRVGLCIEAYAIKETRYVLHGVEFIGIPARTAATGIHASKTNPKRQKELLILKEKSIEPFPNNYIDVRLFGFKMDWIYHFWQKVLNIIGAIRVKMGLAFDPWR